MRRIYQVALACAVFLAPSLSFAAPLFSDAFSNAVISAANYSTATSDATSSFATFAYDYSAMGIPPAPSTGDGSTLGLRLDANRTPPNAAEAITLFTNLSFSGDYTVTFDAWLNVNGDFPDGGAGSTNSLTAGVGSNGVANNHIIGSPTGSGGWFSVNGDNGNGVDYRLYKDTFLQGVATAQYAAGTATDARDGDNAYYSSLGSVNVGSLPVQGASNGGPAQQTGTTYAGSFGMAWHRVKLEVDADGGTGGAASMKWTVDNLLIGTLDAGANGTFPASGKVTVGYSDPTSNASDLPTHSFALFDNLQVVPEPASAMLGVLGLGLIACLRRRKA